MALPKGPALLRAFLKERGVTLRAAGEALDVTHVMVLAWRRRRSMPKDDMRRAIERWSAGAIPADSWLSEAELEHRAKLAAVTVAPNGKAA